jgi:transposase, IS5 family
LRPESIDANNTASEVWADTAYRSKANEAFLAGRRLRSQIHRNKPKGKPMPRRTARANDRKSAGRAAVEHVCALYRAMAWLGEPLADQAGASELTPRCRKDKHVCARQKGPMGLFIRTIGLARARTKIGRANLIDTMQRMVWLTHQIALA